VADLFPRHTAGCDPREDLGDIFTSHFRDFDTDFIQAATAGKLPAYSFIEPGISPTCAALISPTTNIRRTTWLRWAGLEADMLVITYDKHGGCYDHVVRPLDDKMPDGFDFGYFGIRVPAVIISPHVRAGRVIRPPGLRPFDHTSIIATWRKLFGFQPLTKRDAAAPDLVDALAAFQTGPDNDGPPSIAAPAVPPAAAQVAHAGARPPNSLQKSLASAAFYLPTARADIATHIERLRSAQDGTTQHATAAEAATDVAAHVKGFLGQPH
jgi:phospholipase C